MYVCICVTGLYVCMYICMHLYMKWSLSYEFDGCGLSSFSIKRYVLSFIMRGVLVVAWILLHVCICVCTCIYSIRMNMNIYIHTHTRKHPTS